MAERLPIVVYGASGFTGRLVCAALQRRGAAFAVAGRDGRKLELLAAQVRAKEVIVAAVDDEISLRKMAGRGRVVLDCAGPFARLGPPVQEAALEAGSHFLDVTGEQAYMRATWDRDVHARARGVALINAVGFDVVPTDCAAVLACQAAGDPVGELRIAFATRGRPSQGTARSAVEGLRLGGLAYVDGEWRGEPVGRHRREVDFPGAFGRRTCLSVPWGDVASAPRSTGARTVRCFFATNRRTARLLPRLAQVGRLLANTPLIGLAERWVDRLPEGPSESDRQRGAFAVVAEADGPTRAAVWVSGGDGYDFTAHSAALCAELAASPSFSGRGSLTPSQAFGARALLDRLGHIGVAWGVVGEPAARAAAPAE